MPLARYLFIDGRYLRADYSRTVRAWFGNDGEIDLALVKKHFGADKMFYYDCLDDQQHSGESPSDFAARVAKQEEEFNKIQRISGSHIRLGSITGTKRNKRQKKVDILLAVDMMKHAVRQNMSHAILLAGDRDFEPVVETLVDLGLSIEVAGDKRSTSDDLIGAADHFHPLTFRNYYEWTSKSVQAIKPIPYVEQGNISAPSQDFTSVGTGSLEGSPCTLYQRATDFLLFFDSHPESPSSKLSILSHNLEHLKLFCMLYYGELQGI